MRAPGLLGLAQRAAVERALERARRVGRAGELDGTPPRPPRGGGGRTRCRRAAARRGGRAGSSAPGARACAARPRGGRAWSGRSRTAPRPRAATARRRGLRRRRPWRSGASSRLASSALGASISSSSEPSTFDARWASRRGARTWISPSRHRSRRRSGARRGPCGRAGAAATAGRRRAGRSWGGGRPRARRLGRRAAARAARPRVLELGEHALRVVGIALVVARDERLGGGLEPAHGRRIVAAAATLRGSHEKDRRLRRQALRATTSATENAVSASVARAVRSISLRPARAEPPVRRWWCSVARETSTPSPMNQGS